MLGFMSMAGNFESRKVDRFEKDGVLVSTVRVTNSDDPYETAIEHPKYNGGDLVIVETYSSETAAKEGHAKWVKTMTAKKLPESLKDKSGAEVAKMRDVFGKQWRKKEKTK